MKGIWFLIIYACIFFLLTDTNGNRSDFWAKIAIGIGLVIIYKVFIFS